MYGHRTCLYMVRTCLYMVSRARRHQVHRASPVQTEVLDPKSGAISGGCAVLCVVMGIGRVYVYVWGAVGATQSTPRVAGPNRSSRSKIGCHFWWMRRSVCGYGHRSCLCLCGPSFGATLRTQRAAAQSRSSRANLNLVWCYFWWMRRQDRASPLKAEVLEHVSRLVLFRDGIRGGPFCA